MNKKKKRAVLFSILAVLLVVIAGLSFYLWYLENTKPVNPNELFTDNQEKRAGLLLYQNKDLGIEFWYPDDIKIIDNPYPYEQYLLWTDGSKISFELYTEENLLPHIFRGCGADGRFTSIYCYSPEENQISIKENKNLLKYMFFTTKMFKSTLHFLAEGKEPDKTVEIINANIGPFVVVPLSHQNFHVLFYRSSPFSELSEKSKNEFLDIIDTLRIVTTEYVGPVGIYSKSEENQVYIHSTISGSPGEMAGLQKGDRILQINRKDVETAEDVVSFIKSTPSNKKVRLLIERNIDRKPQELLFKIKRETFKLAPIDDFSEVKKALMEYDF